MEQQVRRLEQKRKRELSSGTPPGKMTSTAIALDVARTYRMKLNNRDDIQQQIKMLEGNPEVDDRDIQKLKVLGRRLMAPFN